MPVVTNEISYERLILEFLAKGVMYEYSKPLPKQFVSALGLPDRRQTPVFTELKKLVAGEFVEKHIYQPGSSVRGSHGDLVRPARRVQLRLSVMGRHYLKGLRSRD